jgi:glucose-fructose oxidoreductase
MRCGWAVVGVVMAGIAGVAGMIRAREQAAVNGPQGTQMPAPKPRDVPLATQGPGADSEPLRVVIAGMVHGHVDGFLANALKRKDIGIVGVAEPDRALFDRYAKKYGLDPKLYHEELEAALTETKPQAVLAYTSTAEHRKVVEICAKRGTSAGSEKPLAVMMEKPLAVSSEDAHVIAEVANKANMPVIVNYETTWYRSNWGAYNLLRSGAIGDIRKVLVHDGHQGPKEIGVQPEFFAWLTDPKLSGAGALYDFGCYGADLMTWLMNGERPQTATAVTQQIKPDIYPKVDDEATIVLTYPKSQAIVQASWNWPFDRKDMEVYGQKGYVITLKRDEMEVRLPGEAAAKRVEAKPVPDPNEDSITYLRAVVFGGMKPEGPGSLETNVVVSEILHAARESAKSGKTVRLAK